MDTIPLLDKKQSNSLFIFKNISTLFIFADDLLNLVNQVAQLKTHLHKLLMYSFTTS